MGIKNKRKMSFIFGVFLFKIVIGTILAVAIPLVLLLFLVMYGYILPANYSDMVAKIEAEAIQSTDDLYSRLEDMPGFIHYLVYDADYHILQTDMSQKQQKQGLAFVQEGSVQMSVLGNRQYIIVEKEAVSVLLQYKVEPHYVSKLLDTYLPSPDIMMIVLMFLLTLLNCIIQVRLLAKGFQKELQPLVRLADEISKQNLDCEVQGSRVKEIEEILNSFSNMKEALKDSLRKQWEIERSQKEQVAALAHDLKTPMTVTLGNLDLLCETRLNEEQKQLVGDAQEGLEQMSGYVTLLMEMTMASTQYQYHFEQIQMAKLCSAVCKKAEVLCQNKQISFLTQGDLSDVEYRGDYAMLERAFMNIIRNAVEHTPENGKVCFAMEEKSNDIKIEIIDSGRGFSEKMLKQGTRLFSMEEESRNSESHYGMGLYFADFVIRKHAGELILSNDEKMGGARIIIILKKD